MYSGPGDGLPPWTQGETGRGGAFDGLGVGPSEGLIADDHGLHGLVGDADLAGVSEPWGVPHSPGQSMMGRLDGDFYYEPDTVQRGATHAVADHGFFSGGQGLELYGSEFEGGLGWPSCDKLGDIPSLEAPSLSRDSVASKRKKEVPENTDFRLSSIAPMEVPFGGVAGTSITILGVNGAEAANCAYNFFVTQLPSVEIFKVRLEKYVIKADVIDNFTSSCTIKVRAFSVPDQFGSTLLEFRRYDGDAFLFARTFDQALAYTQSVFPERCQGGNREAGIPPPALAPLQPAPLVAPPVADGHAGDAQWFCEGGVAPDPYKQLDPLLDALTATPSSTSTSANQEEAVAALAALAGANSAGAAMICTALASLQSVLAAFIASGQLNVAYPAAFLSAQIAEHSTVPVEEKLLQTALVSVAADQTDHIVRVELAEAVKKVAERAAIGTCPTFSPVSDLLRHKVAEALGAVATKNQADVTSRLNAALTVLQAPA